MDSTDISMLMGAGTRALEGQGRTEATTGEVIEAAPATKEQRQALRAAFADHLDRVHVFSQMLEFERKFKAANAVRSAMLGPKPN